MPEPNFEAIGHYVVAREAAEEALALRGAALAHLAKTVERAAGQHLDVGGDLPDAVALRAAFQSVEEMTERLTRALRELGKWHERAGRPSLGLRP